MALRDDPQRACSNGNDIDDYPEYHGGKPRLGINGKGLVVYIDEERGEVIEMQKGVRSDGLVYYQMHDMLGDTAEEHIEASAERFGDWWYLDE